jgi:hypothetical protein
MEMQMHLPKKTSRSGCLTGIFLKSKTSSRLKIAVLADAEREREHCHCREGFILDQHPHAETQIL